ncbi:MAG: TIM barrel protein, partial [Myxococcota bacterium]
DIGRGGGRVFSLHLHDNDGVSDQHLLPGGGVVDFAGIAALLAGTGFDGILTMEVAPEPGTGHEDMAALGRQAKRVAVAAKGFGAAVFKGD